MNSLFAYWVDLKLAIRMLFKHPGMGAILLNRVTVGTGSIIGAGGVNIRRPVRLLLLVAMTYCLPKPQSELQAPRCSGRRVIAVANNGDITVDVHVRTAPGPSSVVGSIRPGDRAEFAVPDAGSVSFRPTGFPGGDLRPDERVRIDAQYHCRQA